MTLEVVDAGTKRPATEVLEGTTVWVTVTLTGGHRPSDTYVTVTADVNFDGKIQPGDLSPERGVLRAPGVDGRYRYTFSLPDDGPWPGNKTASDTLTIRAAYGSVVKTFEVKIINLPPRLIAAPLFSLGTDAAGKPVARVTVQLIDVGRMDEHTASVKWSDGKVTSTKDFVNIYFACGPDGGREATVERPLEAGEQVYPVEVRIADDDHPADGDNAGLPSFKMSRLDLALNGDDDNQSSKPDLEEYRVSGEDDLREVDLAPLLSPEMKPANGEFYFSYDAGRIRVWDSADKQRLILPRSYWPQGLGPANFSGIPTIDYSGQESVFVEGIADGKSLLTLSWRSNTPFPSSPMPSCRPADSIIFGGAIDVAVWSIDLDIDSDNNDGFNFPRNDEWEEYLEDSEYGIGKLIYPNASHFTPTRLRLPQGLQAGGSSPYKVRIDYRNAGQSGIVRLWNTSKGDPNRISDKISAGGNMVMAQTVYNLSELNYDATTGGITIWVETVRVFREHSTKKGVEDYGKPDDRIKAVLVIDGADFLSDEVKYMSVDVRTFYPNLQAREELRNAIASHKIYAVAGDTKYALKLLSPKELSELGVPREVIMLLGEGSGVAGFKSGMYLDHISRKFVLAFAGTDDGPDIVADVWQGLGGFTEQYNAAMEVGRRLEDVAIFSGRVVVTGHSLGGGLASAAAVASGFHADTFNAAGLTRISLQYNDKGERIAGDLRELGRFDNSASGLIDAYFLDYDILSFVQDSTPLQDAIGKRIRMDGPLDVKVGYLAAILTTQLASGVGWLTASANMGALGYLMGLCHVTHYYHYGLMVDETTGWDIYGYDNF